MSISPNSFSIMARRLPCGWERRWLSRVVLPEPRKPVRTFSEEGVGGDEMRW